MTERQKFEIAETKERVFQRDLYTCRVCGLPIRQYGTPQLAHIIPQTKSNLRRLGADVIHGDDNLLSVCSLACNSRAMKGGNDEG